MQELPNPSIIVFSVLCLEAYANFVAKDFCKDVWPEPYRVKIRPRMRENLNHSKFTEECARFSNNASTFGRYLPNFKSAIQIPIFVRGLEIIGNFSSCVQKVASGSSDRSYVSLRD